MPIRHFVPMKLIPGESVIDFRVGQVIDVVTEGEGGQEISVPMTVLNVYNNGDFDGEVIWCEA